MKSDAIINYIKKEITPVYKKRRIHDVVYLDAIKVLAAFLVVFYHFAYYKLDYGFSVGVDYIPNISRICMSLGACSVPLFFMVNGALMFKKNRTVKEVYCKALKILFLVIAWSFTNFPSWFFKTLIILYLLFPFLQWLKNKNELYLDSIGMVVFVFPFLYNFFLLCGKKVGVACFMGIDVQNLHVSGAATMYSLLYFIIGSKLFERKNKISRSVGSICVVAGLSLVVNECVIYTNINQQIYDGVNHAFPTIGALLLSIGVWAIISNISFNKSAGIISRIGEKVLSIYVIHSFIIRIVSVLLGVSSMNLIPSLLYTAVICIISICVGKAIEHIPVLCCLVKI